MDLKSSLSKWITVIKRMNGGEREPGDVVFVAPSGYDGYAAYELAWCHLPFAFLQLDESVDVGSPWVMTVRL